MLTLILALAAAPQGCQPFTTDLLAGQTNDVGNVVITNTGDTLRIDVSIGHGAAHHHNGNFTHLAIYAGFGEPPSNGGGNHPPGGFPYQYDFPNGATSYSALIPLSDFGAQCGDTIQIAVHADVHCNNHPDETAWANGQNPFTSGQWGWWIDYDVCCSANANSGMNLSVPALTAGSAATFSVSGALPGESITIYRSAGAIVMGSGWTTSAFGSTVLDIQSPVSALGTSVADVNGVASLVKVIPANAPVGRLYAFQAVALRVPDAAASNPAYGLVQ